MTTAPNDVLSPKGTVHHMNLPDHVQQVFRRVLSCEMATLAADGTPITWPMVFLWRPEAQEFVLSSSVAYPRKIQHVRRDDRVSLLFSDFTGSGLTGTPAVLVQGRARTSESLHTGTGLEDFWRELFRKQPDSIESILDPGARAATPESYYWRVRLTVTPERIYTADRTNALSAGMERIA